MAAAGAGFAAGAGVYALCAWPLGRMRVFGYRGPTVCGWCGYGLAGLTEPRCPECGRAIRPGDGMTARVEKGAPSGVEQVGA